MNDNECRQVAMTNDHDRAYLRPEKTYSKGSMVLMYQKYPRYPAIHVDQQEGVRV